MSKFYKGIVVDNNDPLKRGRVKVKINGIHDDTITKESLVWSDVIQPAFLGISGGTGSFSILQLNTSVWVQYDNDNFSNPIVVGILVGGSEGRNGSFDVDLAYKGAKDHPDWATESIPYHDDATPKVNLSKTGTINTVQDDKYLTTDVIKTPYGHTIEFDNTANREGIRIRHGNGLSCITLNNDGSIDIKAGSIRFNAIEDIMFDAGRNIFVRAKKGIYQKTGDTITSTTKTLAHHVDKMQSYIKEQKIVQVDSGDYMTTINNGMYGLTTKDKINLTSKESSFRAEADTDSVLVAGTANVTMKNNGDACISNQGGNVIVNGNIAKINTNCEVKGGVNATSVIQSSSYMLALDFAPCIPMNTAMQALNESVDDKDNLQEYFNNEVNYINNEYKKIFNEDDIELQKEKFDNLNNHYNTFKTTMEKKSKEVKNAILTDYINNQRSVFGGVNNAEVQMMSRAINNSLTIETRNPDGKKLFEETSSCPCNWLDPSNWFNIDLPVFPTWDDFKNMFEFSIELPDLSNLLPNLPRFSMLALVQMVMQIASLAIIKLLSIFRSMILRFLAPIIKAINRIVGIINMIPPKIKLDLDLRNIIKTPLFNLPKFPTTIGLPNICCEVNKCDASKCDGKPKQYLESLNKKAVEIFGTDEEKKKYGISTDISTPTNTDVKSNPTPNGTEK